MIAELETWLLANTDLMGTVRHRQRLLMHRWLVDLRDRNGGTPQERAWVLKRLSDLALEGGR